MILATLAIIFLVLMILIDWEFWPSLFSWVLLPFVVIYGLWWSNDLALFPFTGEIESEVAFQFLWDATILTVAFFGTVLVWSFYKLGQSENKVPSFAKINEDSDRLGQLLLASKYSYEGKR